MQALPVGEQRAGSTGNARNVATVLRSLNGEEDEPIEISAVATQGEEPHYGFVIRPIARRMRDIRLPARTVLARPNLSLADLMELKVGDVIPVTIGRALPLIVGNRIVAHGTIGEQDGRAAFQIEKLAQEPEQ